jgi:hypothetical protein
MKRPLAVFIERMGSHTGIHRHQENTMVHPQVVAAVAVFALVTSSIDCQAAGSRGGYVAGSGFGPTAGSNNPRKSNMAMTMGALGQNNFAKSNMTMGASAVQQSKLSVSFPQARMMSTGLVSPATNLAPVRTNVVVTNAIGQNALATGNMMTGANAVQQNRLGMSFAQARTMLTPVTSLIPVRVNVVVTSVPDLFADRAVIRQDVVAIAQHRTAVISDVNLGNRIGFVRDLTSLRIDEINLAHELRDFRRDRFGFFF